MILSAVSWFGVLLCVCASIFVSHVIVVFVQLVTSQADSGSQHWRINQGACEVFYVRCLFIRVVFLTWSMCAMMLVGCSVLFVFSFGWFVTVPRGFE